MHRRHRCAVVVLVLLAAAVVAGCSRSTTSGDEHVPARDTATVVDVVDGDTIIVSVAGAHETVRLLGIDAPETKHPRRPVECHGPQSDDALRSLLPPGSRVHVRRDVVARDHFGRLLLYVWRDDGTFVNRELVLRGAARPLTIAPNGAHHDDLVTAAFDAREHRRGWWSLCIDATSLASPP